MGHVQIVILIWLLLSKEIFKIVYSEKTDSISEWHFLATFVYLHNCCYYKKNYIQFFADILVSLLRLYTIKGIV